MVLMKYIKRNFNSIAVFIGLISYYFFSIIALLKFTGGFDILNDLWTHLRWYGYNPEGALFFRIGNLIYGGTLLLFFFGFNKWSTEIQEKKRFITLNQIIGLIIAILMIITELFADIDLIFFITSGLSLLLMIVFLIAGPLSLYHHPKFWKILIIFFIINIGFNSYLLYLGITDALIVEFRIVDFLVTAFNQLSICLIAINMLNT